MQFLGFPKNGKHKEVYFSSVIRLPKECESGQGLDRLDPIPTCFLMFLMEVVKLWMTDGVVKPLLVPAQ